MYKKILVPLDGSKLAECVLPHAESIANGCGASPTVVLLRVAESFTSHGEEAWVPSAKDIAEFEANSKNAAKTYLAEVTRRFSYPPSKISQVVIVGRAADVIADYATKNEVDLIVIATHGRSGISRWVLGGVADRIVRSACVPVFMVRAPGCIPGI